ncbi:hypothetical protein [Algoriphagus aquimarinus]|uniref:Uncharacterized protein n=1 Tax=Algoriphagus aquimarinus TaxID=237018 RepID=A0A1I0XM49_9BACT|nr:hypothetical protein [Algoriphagus aquimarinus]SFB02042.1 hypothetical protein SAMN04489723_103271 [Algoriphagus aquimarinus]
MKFFYLASNPNESGLHEVHDRDCEHIPNSYDRDYLGPFNTGNEAMRKAMTLKNQVGLCQNCCKFENKPIIFSVK